MVVACPPCPDSARKKGGEVALSPSASALASLEREEIRSADGAGQNGQQPAVRSGGRIQGERKRRKRVLPTFDVLFAPWRKES